MRARRCPLAGSTLVFAASFCAAGAAQASPQEVFGYGARSSALAGTGTASAEGYEAVYKNPALLSATHEVALTLGMMGAVFDLDADGDIPNDNLVGTLIGATLPIPLPGEADDRITLGFGFFTPFDLVVRGRILYPEVKQFLVADRTQSIAIQAGLAVDVTAWDRDLFVLRVGGGFSALAALAGNVLVSVDATGKIGSVVNDTLVASYAPILGVQADIARDFRVGLVFRGQLEGRFDVDVVVKDLGNISVPPLGIAGLAQFDPWQIEAEFAWAHEGINLAAAVAYEHWSAYPGPTEATVRCPTRTSSFLPSVCGALVPADPEYSDIVVPRVSLEGVVKANEAVKLKFRGGLSFEASQAPEQTKESNLFDAHRVVTAVGYGLDIGPPLASHIALDLFGQLHVLVPRMHTKNPSEPNIASNPAYPSVDTGGFIGAAGLTGTVAF